MGKIDWAIAVAAGVLAALSVAGCSSKATPPDDLTQQRKDVMGAPAPASEMAGIAAKQAEAAQKAAAGAPGAAQPR
jgi:hypothetical protein